MNILDTIKIKTQQVAMKADQALREHGVMTGMFVGMAGIVAGVAGIAAMATVAVPGAVVAAPIAAAATLASGAGLSIMGVSLNLAGATMLTAGYGGLAFSAFSKLYKNIRNTDTFHDSLTGYHNVKCVDHKGITTEVPALKFYEMVEKNTLKDSFKEVIARVHTGFGVYEEMNYSPIMSLSQASFVQGEQDIEKVRRLLFKNTKDMDFASNLSDKIKNIREKFSTSVPTSSSKLSV